MAKKFKKEITIKTTEEIKAVQPSGARGPEESRPVTGGQPGEGPSKERQPGQKKASPREGGELPEKPSGEKLSEEQVSPSLKKDELSKPVEISKQQGTKDKAKDQATQAVKDKAGKATEPGKKAARQAIKQAAKAAARAVAQAVASAASAVAGVVGWPVLVGCLAIFLIVLLIFGGLMCISFSGYFGKTYRQRAGANDPNVIALIEATQKGAKTSSIFGGSNKGSHKLDFLYQRDYDYVKSGEIDKRLAAALNYVVQKHEHIRISHIVSTYEDIKVDPESGAFHDDQIKRNISAHKDGLAADIDEVDYVKEQCECGSDIPVKIAWQAIDENPFGQAPDALNQIKGPDDFANDSVKEALKKMGVQGLDQQDLVNKIKSIPVLASITSPYDLTKPEVINAFNTIGVTGLDNEDLQKGLKRIQALQNLYDLDLQDINAIRNPQVQSLLQQAGIPVSKELLDNVSKYQAVQLLRSITSPEDLKRADVQEALRILDVNTSDPNFQAMLGKVTAASLLANWEGDYTDQQFKDALSQFGINLGSDSGQALKIYQTASKLFQSSSNGMVIDPFVIQTLEQLAIDIGNPAAQDAVKKLKAAYQINRLNGDFGNPEILTDLQQLGVDIGPDGQVAFNKYRAAQKALAYQGDYTNPEFLAYIETLGVPMTDDTREAINKYKAANNIMQFQGDYTSPEFINSLSKLGINVGSDGQEVIAKYKASQTLADAAAGKIPYDSQQVKDALKTIGASSITDSKAKSAIKIGQSQDLDDPALAQDKKILGIDRQDWQTTLSKLGAAKNLLNVNDFSDLQDAKVQKSLQTLGLQDPKYYDAINKLGSAKALLSVKEISDLQNPNVQKALQNIGLKDPKYYDALGKLGAAEKLLQIRNLSDVKNPEIQKSLQTLGIKNPDIYNTIGKLGSLQTILQIQDIRDLSNPQVKDALVNLGVKNQAVYDNLAKVGSIYTLTQIQSPWDLTKPQVIQALGDLKLADAAMQTQLTKAGSLYALTQIKSPTDLLKPESLKALDTLGVIKLDSQLLGQIGAVQTLLNVNSIQDLLNPNSILALNTLGLISLSNPVMTALMIIGFVDNLMGGKLLGGLLGGDCEGSTKCYKTTAEANNHTVVSQLLQFPKDMNNVNYYKVTQLITYSEARDVTPFSSQLNELYGKIRPKNYGLFAMPEAWDHLHIGY